jgi:hypothetical protein
MCHACIRHDECASSACLPDGACGDEADVAYVDSAGTDNDTCMRAMPCTKVAKALATARPFVKFHGVTDEAVLVGGGRHVTFLGDDGAGLTRSMGTEGGIVTVRDNARLAIYDLAISNGVDIGLDLGTGLDAGNASIERVTIDNNPNIAVRASVGTFEMFKSTISRTNGDAIVSQGTLIYITDSTITNSAGRALFADDGNIGLSRTTISKNRGGGLEIFAADFFITNSFIVDNGTLGTSAFGGVKFQQTNGSTDRFDFNTVANNSDNGSVAGGVICLQGALVRTFRNNIVFGNQSNNAGEVGPAVACLWEFSDIGTALLQGTGNIAMDPQFVNAANGDYHLLSASPARDRADPATTLDHDVDGNVRPLGNGPDMGADEVTP